MSRLSLVLCLTAVWASALSAQTVYVDADATGAATGASWADAYPDLQSALLPPEPGAVVWVAEGTYYPTTGSDRAATFQLVSGIALYGGFDGTETSLAERDWEAHPAILSGDIGVPGDVADNAYHVVNGSGTDASAILDGFIVTEGNANGTYTEAAPRNRGGGMLNLTGSPTVRNVVFRVNRAGNSNRAARGGGMHNDEGSSPTLQHVRFEGNVSEGVGGGMVNYNGSHPALSDVVFIENEAGQLAGGMANESGSSPVLVNVRFERNRSGGWTGGMDNYLDASPRLYNVQFLGNRAANYGGGVTNDTRGAPLFVNVLFVGNTAENDEAVGANALGAAGLQNNGSAATLVGVTFVANEARVGAGGLGNRDKVESGTTVSSGTVTLRDAVLWQNGEELANEDNATLDVSHALVEGGYADGTAILDAAPQFVRPPSSGADAVWGTPDDDYGDLRLRATSPALDAGDAAHLPDDLADLDGDGDTAEPIPLDLSGAARVLGAALDLGPYEGGVLVSNEPSPAPRGVSIGSIYPNPARGSVSFRFALSAPGPVRLQLVDVLGRRVALLLDESYVAGDHTLRWSAASVAAGVYLAVLDANGQRSTRRLALLHP